MLRKLKTQITLTIAVIVLLTIFVISLCANTLIRRKFEAYIMEQQRIKTLDIAQNTAIGYNSAVGAWDADFVHGVGMYALSDGFIVKVFDLSGNVVWDAENHDMSLCKHMMEEITQRMEKNRPQIGGRFAAEVFDIVKNGQKVGTAAISHYSPFFMSEGDIVFLDSLNVAILIIGAASLALSILAGATLARWIAQPIAKTAYIAKQISGGNYAIKFEGKPKSRELNELTTSINRLSNALDEQETLRKRLTVDVAHELRTPLTAVGAHLEAMIEGVWEATPDRLQSCYDEVQRLAVLISDLERLAEAENENLQLQYTDVDLQDIARSVARNFEAESSRKGLSIVIEGESSVVAADRDRLHQVITNLVSNAVKYAHEGGSIRIATGGDALSGEICISDDGIGIPESALPFIFERFYRADDSRNRRTGGAGIGLAIVKSIVQAHGGEVRAKSEVGHGSRFTVRIPRSPKRSGN